MAELPGGRGEGKVALLRGAGRALCQEDRCQESCLQVILGVEGRQAKPQTHTGTEKAMTNADQRQEDSGWPWQLLVEERGAGFRLGPFQKMVQFTSLLREERLQQRKVCC